MKLIYLCLFLIIGIVGCNNYAKENLTGSEINSETSTQDEHEPISTNELEIISTATQTREETVIVEENPDVHIGKISQSCIELDLDYGLSVAAVNGLVLDGRWDQGLGVGVIGSEGLNEPTLVYYTETTSIQLSPDGNWLVTLTITDTIDEENNIYSIELSAIAIDSEEIYRQSYESLSLSRFSRFRWLNDSQIILPLGNQENKYEWLVWTLFLDKAEAVSLEISDVNNAVIVYQVPPQIDPSLEFVTYPCLLCGEVAFNVQNVKTSQIEWSIDFEPSASSAYRGIPTWSPDGTKLAIGGGGNTLNKLKILSRSGDSIFDISLPNAGVAAAERFSWSPNGKFLAFSLATPEDNSFHGFHSTLAYLRLDDGVIVDTCVALPTTSFYWSHDSNKIAFTWKSESDGIGNVISIVDINANKIFELIDNDSRVILGWKTPTN